jgi:cell division initiation protein
MELTPKLLTDVQFREQWRGYKPEEVDEFLERVAAGVGELPQRLADAMQRASTAEKRLLDRSDEDEIRRTLVLAQRTADASMAEARAEADRLVSETEERCRALVADAQAQAAELEAEIAERRRVDLGGLAEERVALERDIEQLRAYVDGERERLTALLSGQVEELRRTDALRDAPAVSDLAAPSAPPAPPAAPAAPQGDVEMRAPAVVDAPPAPEVDDEDEPVAPAPRVYDVSDVPDEDDVPQIEVHDDLQSAREGLADAMRRAGLEDLIGDDAPMSSSPPELFDDRAGDITGEFDSLAEATTPAPPAAEEAADEGAQPMWRGDAGDDDPFLAELRRAVGDTEPLGPRDHDDPLPDMDLGDDDDASGGFLRRRRRG